MSSESVYQDPTWGRMNGWNLVIPPSRPDTLDLARILEAIKHIDRTATVGVLGSTPEFRDRAGIRGQLAYDIASPYFALSIAPLRPYCRKHTVREARRILFIDNRRSRTRRHLHR